MKIKITISNNYKILLLLFTYRVLGNCVLCYILLYTGYDVCKYIIDNISYEYNLHFISSIGIYYINNNHDPKILKRTTVF